MTICGFQVLHYLHLSISLYYCITYLLTPMLNAPYSLLDRKVLVLIVIFGRWCSRFFLDILCLANFFFFDTLPFHKATSFIMKDVLFFRRHLSEFTQRYAGLWGYIVMIFLGNFEYWRFYTYLSLKMGWKMTKFDKIWHFSAHFCARISINPSIFKISQKYSSTLFPYMLWSSGENFSHFEQKL